MIDGRPLDVNHPGVSRICLLLCVGCFQPGFEGILAAQQGAKPVAPGNSIYVQPRILTLWERTSLANVGSRLTSPGAERMIVSGQLFRPGPAAAAVSVTSELPDKIRIDQNSQPGRPLILNGGAPGSNANHSGDDKDLVESLYADTLDQFFLGKTQGSAYKLIGGHRRGHLPSRDRQKV